MSISNENVRRIDDAAKRVKATLHGGEGAFEISKSIDSSAIFLKSMELGNVDIAFFQSSSQTRSICFHTSDRASLEVEGYHFLAIYKPSEPIFEATEHITLCFDWDDPELAKRAMVLHELWMLNEMQLADLKAVFPEVLWD